MSNRQSLRLQKKGYPGSLYANLPDFIKEHAGEDYRIMYLLLDENGQVPNGIKDDWFDTPEKAIDAAKTTRTMIADIKTGDYFTTEKGLLMLKLNSVAVYDFENKRVVDVYRGGELNLTTLVKSADVRLEPLHPENPVKNTAKGKDTQ